MGWLTAIFAVWGTGLIYAGEYVQAAESLLIGTLIYALYRMNLKLEKKWLIK
ncbi:hypothetical protein [Paenibacillus abyssi]|uniref:Uncharacterized protein n=1 Tax=Paenibacillus abyssi TaxID=1340531 RepID=A0A917LHC7_9BACL|nr:hypothetical protein [Paenibacillus abyssi]GGG23811.1 hypothetical protein GCM10010916_45430 [Paenibacillus abyssi]